MDSFAKQDPSPRTPWDLPLLEELIRDLGSIRDEALQLEKELEPELLTMRGLARESAKNLLHYMALRRRDNRVLQQKLASLGLSSLGRAEAHVAATLESVLSILYRLAGRNGATPPPSSASIGFQDGKRLLESHTEALLGPRPPLRNVRIMVTMPGEASMDYALVRDLLKSGMDCMRINCAHDDRAAWVRMIENLVRARKELSRECKLLMDLGGPKLRTGSMQPGPRILHWQPHHDVYGQVDAPARIWLTPADAPEIQLETAGVVLPLDPTWLSRLVNGDEIRFTGLGGKPASLKVMERAGRSRWAESLDAAYLDAETALCVAREDSAGGATESPGTTRPAGIPPIELSIDLLPGDTLVLTRSQAPGRPVHRDSRGKLLEPAQIPCTLPEVFQLVKPGERVWFDDGKIGGVAITASPEELRVRITSCSLSGKKLRADKGINLPDSSVDLPALTPKDLEDLDFVLEHADMIGLSFLNSPADVEELQRHLAKKTSKPTGVVLKIETRRAFEQLPRILLTGLRSHPMGVMIARGDLAVECGYERLAEVQEEILWICEAAHVPVIWATQVLETMAKKGTPSRAEITDAAMGERAECVMLNKGPHIGEAVQALDDILRRMQSHQEKKSPILRPLRISNLSRGSR